MDFNEAGIIVANRIINADRDLVGKLIASLDEMKRLMIAATSTNVVSEVISAFKQYTNIGKENTAMLFALLGMNGGVAELPNSNVMRLYDPETGIAMSGQMHIDIIEKKVGEA